MSVFVKRHHVSLSRNPLALCWAAALLRQSCTPSTALTTPAWSAVQLSRSTFEHPLWDTLPRPHGIPHRGHGVRTQQTTWRGWGRGGGKMKHTQEPNWTFGFLLNEIACHMIINGHSLISFQTSFQNYQISTLQLLIWDHVGSKCCCFNISRRHLNKSKLLDHEHKWI